MSTPHLDPPQDAVDLRRLLVFVEQRRSALAVQGQTTGEADALLRKLRQGLTLLGDAAA